MKLIELTKYTATQAMNNPEEYFDPYFCTAQEILELSK